MGAVPVAAPDPPTDPKMEMGTPEIRAGGLSAANARTTAAEYPQDLDGDGAVGAPDLAILLGSWGPCEGCPADFDGDGMVNAPDLAQLLGAWGMCP